jgi:hypothetical protein
LRKTNAADLPEFGNIARNYSSRVKPDLQELCLECVEKENMQ